MERGNTKQEILNAALDLFSVRGYEGTSLSMIAEAVGIRKASLYSHFENKQAILDALVEQVLSQYNRRSLFARTDWDDSAQSEGQEPLTAERVADLVCRQVCFVLHDPHVSKARKMLCIDQFQNQELARLLHISERQLAYITDVPAGHGLLKVGNALVPFENSFPKNTELYKLMTTKPGEGGF